MVFLAAYAIVLHSYTRKAKLALWGHFSNRGRPEFQNTIGYFVHSHLIGIDFSSDPSGAELLQQVRATVLDACDHQEMPLPYLWQKLNCWPRYADARVLLDYHCGEKETDPSSTGLVIRRAKLPESLTGRFSSLGVYVNDDQERISFSVQYLKARFPQVPVEHLVEDLQVVIARFLADPERKVAAFFDRPRYPGSSSVEPASEMGEFVVIENGAIPSLPVTGRAQAV
jgi:non-ribosomal peptide synthetase component F